LVALINSCYFDPGATELYVMPFEISPAAFHAFSCRRAVAVWHSRNLLKVLVLAWLPVRTFWRRCMAQRDLEVSGREIAQMAFELKEPPRLPVTLIGGGSWMVHLAGKTFAEIKENPEASAKVFMEAFELIGHDLIWMGSGGANYPIHFLGCPIKDDSSDPTILLGTVINSLRENDSFATHHS
jgi:hypothetical protein